LEHETKLSTTSILKPYGKKTSFSFSSSNHQHQINNKRFTYQSGATMMVVKNNGTSATTSTLPPTTHTSTHSTPSAENWID
jgi:hypothetical protein